MRIAMRAATSPTQWAAGPRGSKPRAGDGSRKRLRGVQEGTAALVVGGRRLGVTGGGDVATRAVLAHALGVVEGAVGRPHQAAALDVHARVGRNPGGRGDRPAVWVLSGGDAAEHRLGDLERHRLIPAGQQQRELVAPEAERLPAVAQAACDLDEDAVAGGMPVAVVDALEVVDVDDAQRERKALLVSPVEVTLEALEEMPRVAEPGERVGQASFIASTVGRVYSR